MSLLQVRDVQAAYGESQVLFGMDMSLQPGEVMGLLGRNGMGKTTLIRSILGLKSVRSGQVVFDGCDITNQAADRVARLGLAVVPEGRQVFPNLSVDEHLTAFASNRHQSRTPWTPDRVYALFPRLAERRVNMGAQLSGGEQQMLAIARALMSSPKLLLVDEPSVGLSPLLVSQTITKLKELKDRYQLTVLMAEQNFNQAMRVADYGYIIVHGEIVFPSDVDALKENDLVKSFYLGASH